MNPLDFSVEELDKLFALADDIEKDPAKYAHKCDGKILATCFYEPSTRTRLSFETAMTRLGGRVIGFSDAASSSASKGESVSDTIRIISCYADICAMRHPKEGAPMVAAEKSLIPVINAGDGGHQHPTQTLADLQTIRSLHGDLNNFTIGLCGDLKFGRTVHSLINALVRYEGIKFIFISPEELKIPDYVTDMLREKGIPCLLYTSGVASEAFCLAAYEQGLGTVIMGIFDQQEAADLLEIPENQDLIALIPIGYPAEAPVAPKRKPVTDLLSYQQ